VFNCHTLHQLMRGASVVALVLALAELTALRAEAQQNIGGSTTTVFATGSFQLPEAIAAAPAAFGGGYLIPDANADEVFSIGPNGGSATVFAQTAFAPLAAVTLGSYYSALNGQVLVAGGGNAGAAVAAINQSGQVTNLFSSATAGQISGAAVAPQAFGSIAPGQVVLTATNGGIDVLSANGTSFSTFATLPVAIPAFPAFGIAFDKSQMFVDDGTNGNLYSINTQGQVSLLATLPVPVGAGNGGGRQIAVAPAGFGSYGGDLFVSVSGSTDGGGDLGTIDVVNPTTGALVATYNQGSATNPLDPRGLLFTTINGQTVLLASNGDPEIDTVTSNSFTATAPEIDPASAASALTLLLGGLLVLSGRRRSIGPPESPPPFPPTRALPAPTGIG
jgi:hypothetical protein